MKEVQRLSNKGLVALVLVSLLALSGPVFAAKKSAPESSPADDSAKIIGAGSKGVGFGYLSGRQGSVPTISGDLWTSDAFALELMFGMATYSEMLGGTGTDGKPVNDAVSSFGASVGSRQVFAQHGTGLLFEAIERLSYVNESFGLTTAGKANSTSIGTIGVFGGFGVEAAFPFWQNVAIEINTGLNYLISNTTTTGSSASESALFIGGSANRMPFNFAIHYYF